MRYLDRGQQVTQGTPGVAFIGVCERVSRLQHAVTGQVKYSFLGLSQTMWAPVYPVIFGSEALVLAFFRLPTGPVTLRVVSDQGQEVLSMDLSRTSEEALAETPLANEWHLGTVPLRESGMFIGSPGTYRFLQQGLDGEVEFGQLQCNVLDPGPFGDDRKAALRANPGAYNTVTMQFGCRFCPSRLDAYASLERSDRLEEEGKIWYEEVPDQFDCECGKASVDLRILRRNLHGLLGNVGGPHAEGLSVTQLYERSTLRAILHSYGTVLGKATKEEELQEFIANHLVLLHSFTPLRVLPKAPILSRFKSDFVLVNHRKELVLVELEKPSTRLLTKAGGVASQLQHAIDQVHDWLEVIDEHLLAVLDDLGIDREEVSSVKGVVVAGRAKGYSPKALRSLLKREFGRVSILTYDQLATALRAFIESVERG